MKEWKPHTMLEESDDDDVVVAECSTDMSEEGEDTT